MRMGRWEACGSTTQIFYPRVWACASSVDVDFCSVEYIGHRSIDWRWCTLESVTGGGRSMTWDVAERGGDSESLCHVWRYMATQKMIEKLGFSDLEIRH